MPPTESALRRILAKLDIGTPPLAVYQTDPGPAFEPYTYMKGQHCCFAYFRRWMAGGTVVVRRASTEEGDEGCGCFGAQRAFGFAAGSPHWLAHFLTDGEGAPAGEGLKASAELAQEYLDRPGFPAQRGDSVLIGPLRLEEWQHVRSVQFVVDPDRLAGVLALATYWSVAPDEVIAPFSSACGLLWRSHAESERDHVILGATDLAMRRYMPPDLLLVSVTPRRLEKMCTVPEGSFLDREWWRGLLRSRGVR